MTTDTVTGVAAPAPPQDQAIFSARRARLLEAIGNGVAVVAAAPELLKSRDTEIAYRPSSDLYYLTGFLEPQAVAVITPHDEAHTLTLFVRQRNPEQEAWSGRRLGVEGTQERFHAQAVYPIEELGSRLPDLLRPADRVHCSFGSQALIDPRVHAAFTQSRLGRVRSGNGPTALVDLDVVTGEMRKVKDAAEIESIRIAASISAAGHIAAMQAVAPGMGEWALQAELEAAFRQRGAVPAFPSIVGSGANATILHYVENTSRLADGQLVLIDAGAEWGMYCGDITRTFPVSGRFTAEQRALYDVVLAAENAAIEATRPGAPFTAIHDAAHRVLAQGMLDLGLVREGDVDSVIESGASKRFFLHQASHWIGLDVHDVGLYRAHGEPVRLEPGMVLTIEPGLYIPEDADDVPAAFRGVGIRVEDDVLVTPIGNEVLTRACPAEPDEIEQLIRG